MAVEEVTGARARVREIHDSLHPDAARAAALDELDEMFRSGRAPDPLPEGMLRGRLVTTSVWGPLDSFAQRVARLWMPWLGKRFDPTSLRGVNILQVSGRKDAFPFLNRVAPGEVDSGVDVLKIDYDFEANPPLVRRILDELVQLEDGFYLGKILWRRSGSWTPIGYFTLER